MPVTTPYYREKHARRAKRRPGLYPALVVLGIYDRCTPKLASDASRAVAMLSSLAEAQAQLRSDGIALDIKTLRSTAYRYAARARAAQQSAACGLLDRVTGKRVVVSLDGGRVRVRRKKRGPKTKKGRNRFHTDWKEPKLLILYVVGDDGRPSQTWAPIIDGTLRGPEAVDHCPYFMLRDEKDYHDLGGRYLADRDKHRVTQLVQGAAGQRRQNAGTIAGTMTKVAVTGTANCGKTMFLTSLLWQLEEFDEARFRLGEGITIRGFHPLRGRNREDAFPFHRYRNTLAREYRWPEKTRDTYHYRCAFHRSDRWRIRGQQSVDFFDLPGERIADAAMVMHTDYGAWSDHMLDHLDQDTHGKKVAAQFRDVAARPGAGARDVVLAYRLALARLIRAYKPLVSPSVFLLDCTGDLARNVEEKELVASRRCGIDEAREFAPLPRGVRSASLELTREMQSHYHEYRKKVVLPLFRDLMTAQSLVVLVDIPSLLLAGDQRFGDERQVIIDLLTAMRSGALSARILRALGLRNALQRVAFVAAKADLVSPDDLRKGRLRALLRSMNARAAQALSPAVEVKWFVCSACVSTQPGGEPHTLIGQTQPGPYSPERQAAEFDVSPLPEEWPPCWRAGDYKYQYFWPRVPENFMIPPRHRDLDAIFDFTALR